MIEHFTFHLLLHNAHLLDSISGLHKLCQPASWAVRKWRENEKMNRKWREKEEIERKWTENEEMEKE